MQEKCEEGDEIKVITCNCCESSQRCLPNTYYLGQLHPDNKCPYNKGQVYKVLKVSRVNMLSSSSLGHGPGYNCNVHIAEGCITTYINVSRPVAPIDPPKRKYSCICSMQDLLHGFGHRSGCSERRQ